jgi:hypothetical protein
MQFNTLCSKKQQRHSTQPKTNTQNYEPAFSTSRLLIRQPIISQQIFYLRS